MIAYQITLQSVLVGRKDQSRSMDGIVFGTISVTFESTF